MNFNKLKNLTPKKRRVFHPYFTSQPHSVVSEYIKFFTKEGDTVLDTYSGSGVTLLESRLLERNSIGVDLSPLACFISKSTTNRYEIQKLVEEFNNIEIDIKPKISLLYNENNNFKKLKHKWVPKNVSMPSNSDVKKMYDLFTDRNLEALTILINRINKINEKTTQDFFRGVFSGMLHRASRTFFYDKLNWGGGNSSIFTKYRYWVPANPNERNVWDLFETRFGRLKKLIQDINSNFSKDFSPKIYNESATNLKSISDESIDFLSKLGGF